MIQPRLIVTWFEDLTVNNDYFLVSNRHVMLPSKVILFMVGDIFHW